MEVGVGEDGAGIAGTGFSPGVMGHGGEGEEPERVGELQPPEDPPEDPPDESPEGGA